MDDDETVHVRQTRLVCHTNSLSHVRRACAANLLNYFNKICNYKNLDPQKFIALRPSQNLGFLLPSSLSFFKKNGSGICALVVFYKALVLYNG